MYYYYFFGQIVYNYFKYELSLATTINENGYSDSYRLLDKTKDQHIHEVNIVFREKEIVVLISLQF